MSNLDDVILAVINGNGEKKNDETIVPLDSVIDYIYDIGQAGGPLALTVGKLLVQHGLAAYLRPSGNDTIIDISKIPEPVLRSTYSVIKVEEERAKKLLYVNT